jgi:hypothetical protein
MDIRDLVFIDGVSRLSSRCWYAVKAMEFLAAVAATLLPSVRCGLADSSHHRHHYHIARQQGVC